MNELVELHCTHCDIQELGSDDMVGSLHEGCPDSDGGGRWFCEPPEDKDENIADLRQAIADARTMIQEFADDGESWAIAWLTKYGGTPA